VKRILRSATPLLVLLAEVLIFYRQVLFSRVYAIPYDLQNYHLPLAYFTVKSLNAGQWPLWNPYNYCGSPFLGNLQAQLFYPPAWITFGLAKLMGADRLLKLLEWQTVLHVLLGGVLAYWLLRRLRLTRGSAAFGATVFQLGGFFASQTQHLGAVSGGAWLPLVWLSVIELGQSFRWRWAAALALSLAMATLAGYPAVTAVAYVSGLALAVLQVWSERASRWLLAAVALGCAWSLVLAAVQLIPTAELIAWSPASHRGHWGAGGVPLRALGSLLRPDFNGIFDLRHYKLPYNPTFLYLYCGLPALVLVWVGARARLGRVLALLTLGMGLWMLGCSTALGRWVALAMPAAIKAPTYAEFAMVAAMLGVAVLAAFGAERWVAPRGAWLSWLLVVVAAVDLTVAGSGRFMNTMSLKEEPGVTSKQFEGSPVTLNVARLAARRTVPPGRIEAYDDSKNWTVQAPITGIPSANGDDPLVLERFLRVRRLFAKGEAWERYYELSNLDSPLLDLLNIRYLTSWAPTGEPNLKRADFPRIEALPGHHLYENQHVLPRFFLVGETRAVGSLEEALEALFAPGFDPRRVAVVEGVPGWKGSPDEEAKPVEVVQYGNNRVKLRVELTHPVFMSTSEAYYPGWRASVDGREVPLVLTNAAFRGLPLEAGRHRIEMVFRPVTLWYGAAISLLGLAAVLGTFLKGSANQ
jgi:hypothetical protein